MTKQAYSQVKYNGNQLHILIPIRIQNQDIQDRVKLTIVPSMREFSSVNIRYLKAPTNVRAIVITPEMVDYLKPDDLVSITTNSISEITLAKIQGVPRSSDFIVQPTFQYKAKQVLGARFTIPADIVQVHRLKWVYRMVLHHQDKQLKGFAYNDTNRVLLPKRWVSRHCLKEGVKLRVRLEGSKLTIMEIIHHD